MHFSKTYSQLLLTLPPELQQNAIEYRQLKKLINKVVLELTSLGLSPAVLHTLLQANEQVLVSADKGKQRALGERPSEGGVAKPPRPKAVYEVVHDGEHLQPRLRVWVGTTAGDGTKSREGDGQVDKPSSPVSDSRVAIFLDKPDSAPSSPTEDAFEPPKEDLLLVSRPLTEEVGKSLIWSLQRRPSISASNEIDKEDAWSAETDGARNNSNEDLVALPHPVKVVDKELRISPDGTRELIIPLSYDSAFFDLLHTALQSLAAHLLIVRANFVKNLEDLAKSISNVAKPQSSTSRSFQPTTLTNPQFPNSNPLSPFSSAFVPGGGRKSDLYAWREIFQLYVESEVFESMSEKDRGERDILETEKRLSAFAARVTDRGLSDSRKLKSKKSRDALESFLQMNVLIVNLKKFQFANAEATRKILKKHAKRTALPFPMPRLDVTSGVSLQIGTAQPQPSVDMSGADLLALIPSTSMSLPHILVQAVGEILLPIIPSLDDYQCLICGDIAFKPIRLGCGHLFCVRCLVKMQKRGQDQCPCCRAPVVLKADRSNVDWALINFMQDWFPREAEQKRKQNEREAAQEQLEELGITDQGCIIM